jgi:hypothetical protein
MLNLTEHDLQDAFKMTDALGTVHTSWRGLFGGWRWPVGPKSAFDQMAIRVREIMYTISYAPTTLGYKFEEKLYVGGTRTKKRVWIPLLSKT